MVKLISVKTDDSGFYYLTVSINGKLYINLEPIPESLYKKFKKQLEYGEGFRALDLLKKKGHILSPIESEDDFDQKNVDMLHDFLKKHYPT